MIIRIEPGSPTPPYEQLRVQLATMIESGSLPVGHRLAPVRQLANDLGLAVGTVARTYRELEHAGLVKTAGRHGTIVDPSGEMSIADRRSRLREAADAFVRTARQLGVADDDAQAALTSAGLSAPAAP
ncbi:MAG: GntR family transcriptional regulator [Ilumatobacteraceae bacterium]